MSSSRPDSAEDAGLYDQALPAGTIRVLQLTDTHLYADPSGTLLGVNTHDSFQRVVAHFRDHHWAADVLLATGDLVHDASPQGYAELRASLAKFNIPVFCLPGNHDDPPAMRNHLPGGQVVADTVCDFGPWRFVMLDSVIPGSEGGHLAAAELDRLRAALETSDRHTLVCMHHQAVPVGSAWLDTMAIDNPEPLFEIIDQAQQVRGLLWGHIHQTFEGQRGSVRLMGSPSTCVQFAPQSETFEVDEEPPGFRLLALLPNGEIRSQVVRIDDMPQGLEVASAGY
jgi:Icc protein